MTIPMAGSRPPLQLGETAPDFSLPLVTEAGRVSLKDYLGRTPVLLVLWRSIRRPFCRRRIAQSGGTRAKLEALGIEALNITEDSAEPVRSYYRIRASKLRLATDPKRDGHRRYG